MKGKSSILAILSFTIIGQFSCMEEHPVPCTKVLRSFVLRVQGEALDDYYTLREINGDTIRRGYDYGGGGNDYWVMDDRMNETLQGKTENFRFQGVANGTVVVSELFIFRGGPCHLEKSFGKKEIDI